MGNIDYPHIPDEAGRMDLPGGVFVISEPDLLISLGREGKPGVPVTTVPLALDAGVPEDVVRRAAIVVIQADPGSPRSMQRIGELRAARPFMPLIVALRDSDLRLVRSLIREGVNDVVALPFEFDQLHAALLDAAVGAEHVSQEEVALAPLYAVVGSVGGVGATTIATHLAGELSRDRSGCCLLDLDVQFGAVAANLGIAKKGSVADLFDARDRLDGDLLQAVAADRGDGLRVVGAPPAILPLEEVDPDQVLRILKLARRHSGSVVLDLPTNFTSWSLSALLQSTAVVLVVELTIASLRQARRRIDLLTEIGLDRRGIKVVVNRVERRLFRAINLSDVELALGVPATASLSSADILLSSAQDQGVLAQELERKNRFSKDVEKLADLVRAAGSEV